MHIAISIMKTLHTDLGNLLDRVVGYYFSYYSYSIQMLPQTYQHNQLQLLQMLSGHIEHM